MDWVPRSVRSLAREIERASAALEHRLRRAPTDEEMALELGCSVRDFRESLVMISHSSIAALDELWSVSDSSDDHVSLLDWQRAKMLWRPEGLELRIPLHLGEGALASFAADEVWSEEPLASMRREIWTGGWPSPLPRCSRRSTPPRCGGCLTWRPNAPGTCAAANEVAWRTSSADSETAHPEREDPSGDQVSDRLLLDTTEDPAAPDPAKALDVGDLKDRIADAIAVLPEREKLVIALYYYENLTLPEIGEVLGVTESRISQLHTQAVLRLRASMRGRALRGVRLRASWRRSLTRSRSAGCCAPSCRDDPSGEDYACTRGTLSFRTSSPPAGDRRLRTGAVVRCWLVVGDWPGALFGFAGSRVRDDGEVEFRRFRRSDRRRRSGAVLRR